MKLDKYLELTRKNQRCAICTYRDNFTDMIEVERDGEKTTVHKECLENKHGEINRSHLRV